MCGRFVSDIAGEALADLFDLKDVPVLESSFNVAPTQSAAVIRNAGDHNRLDLLQWGLVPEWSKDPGFGSHLINARSETVLEKPAFRHSIRYRRCIIPASGFYEWQHSGKPKQPFYFRMCDGSVMCLAGLWESWKSPDGSLLETFAILTTPANRLVAPLHDRMPVILFPDDFSLWLNRNMHDPKQLLHVFKPFPEERLLAQRVSDQVNNSRFNGPACIDPV